MNEICFVTGNKNKLREVQSLLSNYKIVSLDDLHFSEDIAETENTIQGNAELKAKFINNRFNIDCFSDDTGLFIDSLDGLPGVKSARYAGDNCSSDENIDLVLKNLKNISNRNASFRTVICLIKNNKTYLFEGVVNGKITEERVGHDGFGYDPIFIPQGHDKTFSELTINEKNAISHRGIAINKLVNFLNG